MTWEAVIAEQRPSVFLIRSWLAGFWVFQAILIAKVACWTIFTFCLTPLILICFPLAHVELSLNAVVTSVAFHVTFGLIVVMPLFNCFQNVVFAVV